MKFGSVCSGIEAASVAWESLCWKPAWFSEIDKFPSAVLSHHYPNVPNLGDMTKFKEWQDSEINVFVGGTPCQSFSVAGLRKGLDDPRGNLMLTYLAIAAKYRPKWVVWENVPGVLSSNGGRDFGTFLAGLGELGYGFAYRVLDAQYFGVAQRRRRVFVVGYFGDWRRAAAVLFERDSLSWGIAPSKKARQVAPTIPSRRTGGGGIGTDFDCDGGLIEPPYKIANCLTARTARTARTAKGLNSTLDEGQTPILVHGTQDPCISDKAFALGRNSGQENVVCVTGEVTHTLRADGFDGSEEGTGRGCPIVSVHENQRGEITVSDTAGTVKCAGGKPGQGYPAALVGSAVRRLTPRECERLQGFPDDYTLIPYRGKSSADGPRYKALGNSMAVPVMRWIGERIEQVNSLGKMMEAGE